MVRLSVGVLVATLFTNPLFAEAHNRPGASPDQTVALIKAWTDAAGWLVEGRDLLNTPSNSEQDGAERTFDNMRANRLAKNKFENARRSLPQESEFEPESIAARVVGAQHKVIQQLTAVLDAAFQLSQKLLAAKNMEELAPLMSDAAELSANGDEIWKLLPKTTAFLTWVLVDQDRTTDGKLQHLRLNRAQRQALLTDLDDRFPKLPKKFSTGQHAVEASLTLLKQFLMGPHLSADDPREVGNGAEFAGW